ncbi:MAG: YtxH domain-containing protein [Flavobacteriales bacterium]|jgi:gas vesicle protein|nr:YtxH domain-containing protein [Flavobacteriales bacterium]MBP7448393.1 YtxH domain-containing protein [Flavobacteriales bacterium]HOZ40493.1 YtxH domain-containing protein [Flavobacteriales bacterium]
MSNERTNGLLGFLAGAAVGATLGVLFAPRSGKETRERIANKAGGMKDELEEFIDQARGEWSKAKGKASDAATMTKDEVTDFVRFLFEEGKDLKSRLANDVADAADKAASKTAEAADRVRHSAN